MVAAPKAARSAGASVAGSGTAMAPVTASPLIDLNSISVERSSDKDSAHANCLADSHASGPNGSCGESASAKPDPPRSSDGEINASPAASLAAIVTRAVLQCAPPMLSRDRRITQLIRHLEKAAAGAASHRRKKPTAHPHAPWAASTTTQSPFLPANGIPVALVAMPAAINDHNDRLR